LLKPEPEQQEQLYLTGRMSETIDNLYLVGVATNDFADMLPDYKGIPYGDYQIVVYDPEHQPNHLKPILKSSQVGFRIRNVYPNGKYPHNVVYFSGGINHGEGEEWEHFYGKVNIETQKYDTFEGDFYGMIWGGSYQGCYLVQRGDLLYIFHQSPVGESYSPVVTPFNPKEYFGDVNLWDPSVRERIMNWLHYQ
jgi:hypothetical protein